ncbi:conserved hypothetical protein [Candidatus Glomeribacter gigasporarum BEG34]|uniref:Type III secretion apparatus protein OrgA/MxiK n=1 Tax=Candidatus Glomeribacter gigasporarum BEG34 TaxID=1070319 RepID=G2J8Y8_9BURK|nr:type III secretion system domain-containing protein [Candidatus Glomeribacter gigasporarum]CCD29235.1 conserved hypothetical protein [Candidatus Glomeribacter gigasporarum BEG34]
MTSIEPNIARLYTLIWRPGASMHPLWWKMLELDACQPVYCTIPHCRRWIDQAIVARRKFPAAVAPCALTPLESHVLSLSERLPALLLALGLLRLAQPEYWVLKSYLKVVQPYLDAVSCAQLNMFSTARAPEGFYARDTRATLVEPEQLIEVAWMHGAAALAGALPNRQTAHSNHALRALEILFAPGIFNTVPLNKTPALFGLKMLFRLARFL